MSEVRSALTGRIVDSYTNILTVTLFARPRDEDAFVREAVDEHTVTFRRQLRLITLSSLRTAKTAVRSAKPLYVSLQDNLKFTTKTTTSLRRAHELKVA